MCLGWGSRKRWGYSVSKIFHRLKEDMKKVAIVGVGHGKFGVRSDASLRELAFEAVKACLQDAGVSLKEVDNMVTGIAGDEFSIALQPSAQVHDYPSPTSVSRVLVRRGAWL
jgi:acetyl-CoA acetyltransferase